MNSLKKLIAPPRLALGLGMTALALMAALMLTGLDERELFIPGHYAGILLGILSAVMVALTLLSVGQYNGKARYGRMFPASAPAAVGILGAAAAAFGSAWTIFTSNSGVLELSVALLGLISGVCLVYLAWCRFRGLRGSFLLWSIATGFLMMRLMLSYRDWSAMPELLRYCFSLFASVCVTLAFYYRTAFSVGMGNRRMYLFFTQMGTFFCLTTLGAGFDLFYLGMALWCLLDLTALRPFKTASREEPPEEQP